MDSFRVRPAASFIVGVAELLEVRLVVIRVDLGYLGIGGHVFWGCLQEADSVCT